jgi:transposase
VLVGDRGMITSKRIENELSKIDGLDWITALRSDGIRKLIDQDIVQPSLFDDRGLLEVVSEDFPGERLVVCKNPFLAESRRRKREDLLAATETELEKIAAATRRKKRALRGEAKIAERVGKVVGKYRMAKHFIREISDDSFEYRRDEESIERESRLDGLYVVRTSLPVDAMSGDEAVRAYKSLSKVERAFRCLKTVDLKVRPIYHRKPDRVRAHVFLCMLAYYVEWRMRRDLADMLFEDADRALAESTRKNAVAPAPRSDSAKRKDASKRTGDGLPVHGFRSLLKDLATLTKNRMRTAEGHEFYLLSSATPVQQAALARLGVKP